MTVITDSVQTGRIYNQSGTREFAPCTAWVNFNGTGTVAIRDSLNVSSITDNGVGDYTVNFAQAMDNTNYFSVAGAERVSGVSDFIGGTHTHLTSSVSAQTRSGSNLDSDVLSANVAIFGGITL